MENLKPNQQRAKQAIVLIWIMLVIELISLLSSYLQFDLLQLVKEGGEVSEQTAAANDSREQIIAWVYLAAYIISAITFIRWFRRAYYNLHLKTNYLSHTEGWAAGAWFIPIFHYYKPYQIMKELYQETKGILNNKGLLTYSLPSTRFLGLWWTLWIISSLLGQIVFRLSMNAHSIDDFTITTSLSIIGNIIGIPLALITIKLINDYSRLEQQLFELKDEEETTEQKLVLTW